MMDPNSLAKEFMCPICNMLPFDPVIAEDGFVYDKECIDKFIAIGRSPMTGEQTGATLISSNSVRETIQVLAQYWLSAWGLILHYLVHGPKSKRI
jgi:hypothetical protein